MDNVLINQEMYDNQAVPSDLKKVQASISLDEFLKDRENGDVSPCYKSGFDKLDECLEGGLFPGLYIMGAISSMGKTTLFLQIADQLAMQGHDVLYFSLEMSRKELIAKSLSRLMYQQKPKSPYLKNTRGLMFRDKDVIVEEDEQLLFAEAVELYKSFSDNLYFVEGMGNVSVRDIQRMVEEHYKETGRVPVVFIDYLQILAPYDTRRSDKQNTDISVLELKRLSRDNNIPVLAISSFNRESYSNEVSMQAFKESGAIEYGSDVLLGLQPEGVGEPGNNKNVQDIIAECKRRDERRIEVVVLKNRNGRTGHKRTFIYNAPYNTFKEA